MNAQTLRDRYVGDSIATASPARLLVMLYDRLLLDLDNAGRALTEGDAPTASAALGHAQEIVLELRASLREDLWSGGPALASLYAWLVTELLRASVQRDAAKVAACRSVVEPLADAWRQAAGAVAATGEQRSA